jgi:hypothetical protein
MAGRLYCFSHKFAKTEEVFLPCIVDDDVNERLSQNGLMKKIMSDKLFHEELKENSKNAPFGV